ncbi:MAG TPA: glycosyltransferase family 1 protein [Chthoniobacterales bacterium]|jgi:glycosyltransferase involved in cell wall biosynthesis|nr:glycosyltransferase family 1 protein [Chthoniobacterales bacterium]
MRVGILAPIAPKEIGGGYTFEQEIFHQLLELAPASKHEFVIFEGFRDAKNGATVPGFRSASLRRPLWDHFVLRKRKFFWEFKWIDSALKHEGIEFFLNTTFEAVTLTIPFSAIVWDLQHRLQPHFPEVSANGMWEHREEFYSQVLKRATFVIVGTEAGRQEVQRFYSVPDAKIRILPHPTPSFALDESAATPADLAKFKLPPDYVFYPAQFWSHKNHAAILRAVAHLKKIDNLRLPVVFTGSDQGNERNVRDLVDQLELHDQVFFLGHVSRQELRALYQSALCLCYVSFFGPENLPPLEAFGLGCPVIAADVPGASEQLGNAAIRVNPSNDLEIAKALKILSQDKTKRDELIRRGKERARRFTGADFAEELIALLDEFETIRRSWSADS